VSELHIYDFDATLYRSPGPPEGRPASEWWDSPVSLDGVGRAGFDARWRMNIVRDARESIADPDVEAVVLTGRRRFAGLARAVERALSLAGLRFDDVILRPMISTGDVFAWKAAEVGRLLAGIDGLEKVTMYDDNADNLRAVRAVVERAGLAFAVGSR